MNATVHAVAMLALFPLVLVLLKRFGSFPQTWKDWFMAPGRGLGGFVFVIFFIMLLTSPPMCGPAPYTQVMLAAASAGMCVALGQTRKIRFWLCVMFIAAGVLLRQHYFSLLRSTEDYVGFWGRWSPIHQMQQAGNSIQIVACLDYRHLRTQPQ